MRIALVFAAIIASGPPAAYLEGEPTLAEVIALNAEARGGVEALDAIQNIRHRARVTEWSFTVEGDYRATRDGWMRVDIFADGKRVFSEGIDADGAWQAGGGEAEVKPVSESGAAILRRGIDFNLLGLHRFEGQGYGLKLVGREVVAGVDYHVIAITFTDGFITHFYVHPDTWLVERQRDVRALHPDSDPTERLLEKVHARFERHCGVVTPMVTVQIDVVSGETLQTVEMLERGCNLNPGGLRISRDQSSP
jgi:hypothetical protein